MVGKVLKISQRLAHFTVYSDKYACFSECAQLNFTSIRKRKIRKSPLLPISPATLNFFDNPGLDKITEPQINRPLS